ncbi:MAG: glycosyltransferase family 4 protein [Candidatus Verstraetearchaeota archaeon]|nr:glycosyltransferase family 4 protein [Candidatus Verstraetearchaeota archaeon]
MRSILHITWEYPPWVVGELSQRLKQILPSIARQIPSVLVVRGGHDRSSKMDDMILYEVGPSTRTSPHVLAYAHALNLDLVRGGCRAIHEQNGISLIHTHDWISSMAGMYLSSCFKIPFVISVYTTEIMRAGALTSLLSMGIYDVERYCFHRANVLSVQTEEMRRHLVRDYGVEAQKILVSKGEPRDLLELYSRWTH